MESLTGRGISSRVSTEPRAASDTAKRVRKLRWTGMASEAEALPDAISNNVIVAPRRHSIVIQTMPSHGATVNRTAKIERNIAALAVAFPRAFSTEPEQMKPLSIGIKQRIYARCTLSHREVGDALRRYTGRVAYLHVIVEGAVRIDLDGTASGNVTAKEATHAAEEMKRILAIAAGKPKDKIEPNAPAMRNIRPLPEMADSSNPGPRRFGIADLRRAGIARRITKEEAAQGV